MNEKFLKAKMKKIFIMMFAFVSLTASAQGIKSGSKWNISNLVYEAKVNTDKTITFTAMAEGEELAFRLTPSSSKKNEYVLSEEQNADGFNPFSKTPRAKYIEKEGWKLICLYDQKGNLHNVLDGSFFGDGEKVAMGKWMQQIMGKYVDGYGDTLEIGHEIIYEKGVARAEYKNIAFNGRAQYQRTHRPRRYVGGCADTRWSDPLRGRAGRIRHVQTQGPEEDAELGEYRAALWLCQPHPAQ